MALLPKFRRTRSGDPWLKPTEEADKYHDEQKKSKQFEHCKCKPLEVVIEEAKKAIAKRNGEVDNKLDVMGEYVIQFGAYRGKTFRWLLENYLGYAIYIAEEVGKEEPNKSHLGRNKSAFREYAESFKEVRCGVEKRKKLLLQKKAKDKGPTETITAQSNPSVPPLAAGLVAGHISLSRYLASKSSQYKPNLPPPRTSRKKPTSTHTQVTATSTRSEQADDKQELCAAAEQVERAFAVQEPAPTLQASAQVTNQISEQVSKATKGTQTPQMLQMMQTPKTTALAISHIENDKGCSLLPEGWRKSLPKEDQLWVSQALFKISEKTGKAEMDYGRINKLWWDPPQPPLITSQCPRPDRYFAHRLLLWMPRKLWNVKLLCPHPGCEKKELTSGGLYHNVRQVLDLDSHYNLASEYLECRNCKRKVISWSPNIVKQLNLSHQLQFPVLLTYQYACDVRVIRPLRQRSLGNSSTLLYNQLTEEHSEKWLQRTSQYLTECKYFADASKQGLLTPPVFEEPPKFIPVPKYKWLLTVYAQDIMNRIDHIKASLTSTFGSILKMDSTKKIVKKLAGKSKGTAAWATNVGNEKGQVLMSVLTSSEGYGLDPMAKGLMRRYTMAGVPPPRVIYVDRDCCGGTCTKTKDLFSLWDDMAIRLDIWHFIRRFAAGCNTESHPLCGIFLARLSKCIFEFSEDDLKLLKSAKKSEMELEGINNPSDGDVVERITKRELSLHCRKKTRGEVETTLLIFDLLQAFTSMEGKNIMGFPLLDYNRTWEIWNTQKHHIPCIQDPEGIQLYVRTGTVRKGNITLPTYRCARGSTSLESFHLHINRFIPGTSASDCHFQAYLLEGLQRWNADRAADAVSEVSCGPETYSGEMSKTINELSEEVLGKKVVSDVREVCIHTGEQIGLEYLFNETGRVLQDTLQQDVEGELSRGELLSDIDLENVDEGFDDNEDYTLDSVDVVFSRNDSDDPEGESASSTSDEAQLPSVREEFVGLVDFPVPFAYNLPENTTGKGKGLGLQKVPPIKPATAATTTSPLLTTKYKRTTKIPNPAQVQQPATLSPPPRVEPSVTKKRNLLPAPTAVPMQSRPRAIQNLPQLAPRLLPAAPIATNVPFFHQPFIQSFHVPQLIPQQPQLILQQPQLIPQQQQLIPQQPQLIPQPCSSGLQGSKFQSSKRKNGKESTAISGKRVRTNMLFDCLCSQCGEQRDTSTHKQYYFQWHCQKSSTLTFEEWRNEIKIKRQQNKKQ